VVGRKVVACGSFAQLVHFRFRFNNRAGGLFCLALLRMLLSFLYQKRITLLFSFINSSFVLYLGKTQCIHGF
jgi:hypothetical protein